MSDVTGMRRQSDLEGYSHLLAHRCCFSLIYAFLKANHVFILLILRSFCKVVVVSEGSPVRGSTISQGWSRMPKALTGAEAL